MSLKNINKMFQDMKEHTRIRLKKWGNKTQKESAIIFHFRNED